MNSPIVWCLDGKAKKTLGDLRERIIPTNRAPVGYKFNELLYRELCNCSNEVP